ncbi:MAG: hypothetical protein IK120_00995 [Muribaculaceae bacterium]|nr:hypothetical protein [Muribaculaceae bacterium]MBR5435422.1 hypothetical protein [Muribaculaceae bacterium]
MIISIRKIALMALSLCLAAVASAKIPVDSTVVAVENERVIVGKDTVSTIIPEKNFSRYDRGLVNHLFITKGSFVAGLTASYAEFNTDDVQVLSVLKDLNFKGHLFSFKPYISYFYGNNKSIGLSVSISNGSADLSSLSVDFDDDINFDISDVSYSTSGFAIELFHRRYIGLSRQKRFGVFNETNLSFGSSKSDFKRTIDSQPRTTSTTKTSIALNFCPGVTCFILDNVNFNLAFGIFSLNYSSEKQVTNGMDDGTRKSSGANFKFDLLNINFGLGFLF